MNPSINYSTMIFVFIAFIRKLEGTISDKLIQTFCVGSVTML